MIIILEWFQVLNSETYAKEAFRGFGPLRMDAFDETVERYSLVLDVNLGCVGERRELDLLVDGMLLNR